MFHSPSNNQHHHHYHHRRRRRCHFRFVSVIFVYFVICYLCHFYRFNSDFIRFFSPIEFSFTAQNFDLLYYVRLMIIKSLKCLTEDIFFELNEVKKDENIEILQPQANRIHQFFYFLSKTSSKIVEQRMTLISISTILKYLRRT